MNLHFLRDEDVKVLKELIERERREVRNPRNRPAPTIDLPQTPDVYVALTPSSGITARSGAFPGQAECQIYSLTEAGQLEILESVPELTRTVYNLGITSVPPSRFILVSRDKFGKWYVLGFACIGSIPPDPLPDTGTAGDLPAAITLSWDATGCPSGCASGQSGTVEMPFIETAQWQYTASFTPSGCPGPVTITFYQTINGSNDWYWTANYASTTVDSGGPIQPTSTNPFAFPQIAPDFSPFGSSICDANILVTAEE